MLRLASAAAIASALLVARPTPADACQPPPPVTISEPLYPITGVPVSGVVPIFVYADPSAAADVTVTVRDLDDAVVTGTFELQRYRLVWRADAPLAPQTTYALAIDVTSWGDHIEATFTTGAADDPTPGAPALDAARTLTERETVADSICCDPWIGSCDWPEYDSCWTQDYEYLPGLALSMTIDDDIRRYWSFETIAGGAETSSDVDWIGGTTVDAVFSGLRTEYCVVVKATSLLDPSDVVQRKHCAPDSERVVAERSEPEEPDPNACEGPLVDGETGEMIPGYEDEPPPYDGMELGDEDGGCSAGGGGAGGTAWLVLLAALGLVVYRRR